MKRFFYLFLGGILLIGCQDRLSYLSDTRDDAPITKAEELSTDFSIDEPYTFISENNSKIWADVIGIEDRFQVCEVPEEDLKRMTTEALVKTMLKYPLNVIYSAYDAPLDAIRLIFKNSALHRELAGRDEIIPNNCNRFPKGVSSLGIKSSFKTLVRLNNQRNNAKTPNRRTIAAGMPKTNPVSRSK